VFSTICSSRSTKREPKPSGKDKNRANPFTLLWCAGLAAFTALTLVAQPTLAARPGAGERRPPAALPFGVFGSLELRTNATKGLGEWRAFQAAVAAERRLYEACDSEESDCPEHLRPWRRLLKALLVAGERRQLEAVNAWVNRRIRYMDDDRLFGRRDLWASPAVSLAGRGDCEDYALAKYQSLRELGFAEDRLRVVIVTDMRRRIGHAVLAVATADGLVILDNLNAGPVRHEAIAHYKPIYSLNASGRWLNIATRRIGARYVAALEGGNDPALAARRQAIAPLALVLRPTLIDDSGDLPAASPLPAAAPASDWRRELP
jgi:predicted transglutaminase-like cysteine proteinase